jgi:NAD(P)-dependent dehydrogenase (short-subunit alcohol dehydrogenase family)
MHDNLNHQVAIVTGAGQGIGAAIARTLAAAGACVAVNDLNPDRAQQVAAEIGAAGGQAIAVAADVGSKFQCVHLIETTGAAWGRLDILVNNAAIEPNTPILKMDEWEWMRCLDVNLKGTFFMSQLCGRVMAEQNQLAKESQSGEGSGGVIVNIGSTAGIATALEGRAAYCASKAGMVGFARECAREFAAYGIRVNTVLPGLIDTPLTERGRQEAATLSRWLERIPLGRLGLAEEVAQVVLFLCSQGSSYMTGSVLTVDGGRVMV